MDSLVRRATVDDAKSVADVLNAVIAEGRYTLFDAPFSEDDERRFISSMSERSAMFVAEIEGKVAGVQVLDTFLSYGRSTRHVATMGTWLRAQARGQGIGRRLASHSFRFAREHAYEKIVIHVLAGNDRALRFYRRLGFQDIGIARKHVFLEGRFHDEIYMEKLSL